MALVGKDDLVRDVGAFLAVVEGCLGTRVAEAPPAAAPLAPAP